MQRALLVASGLVLWSCGSSSSKADAAPGGGVPDSSIVLADAPVSGAPDAPAGGPEDAKVSGSPDAKVSGTADASATGVCIPQCYIDLTSPLITPCPTSGTCTMNLSGPSIVTCYANGVKVVTTIGAPSTTTFKKANGDTCFSIVTSVTNLTSATTTFKDSGGNPVATLTIPDISMPNLVDYACGNGAPVMVDLSNPACMGQLDGGVFSDAGTPGCTFDVSCTP